MKFDFINMYEEIKGLNLVLNDQDVVIFKMTVIYYDFVLLRIFS